jgi:hypothetical protein
MCACAYGTIYGWRPEMDLYLSLLPAVFAASPLESPLALGSLLQSLLKSLLERAVLERAVLREE